MEILTINVGQGAFVVVRDPDEAVIIDTRIPSGGDRSTEYVKGALALAVKDRNVRGLVLTGFDRDHADVSGVAISLRKYRPDWVMYPMYKKPTAAATAVFDVIRDEEQSRRSTRQPLERLSIRLDKLESRKAPAGALCSAMSFELFSPHPDGMDSSNDSSLVAKISSRVLTYLVTGDAEVGRWETIGRLFRGGLKSDVMAAPHHGSRNGAHLAALQHIQPHTVLISAGVGNSYGHPHREALAAFRAVGAEVHSTHEGHSLHTYRDRAGRIRTDRGSMT